MPLSTDQLKEMFLAQEAWDHVEQDKDMLAKLVTAISVLSQEITKLNELLAE